MSALKVIAWVVITLALSCFLSVAAIATGVLLAAKKWYVSLTIGNKTWRKSRGDWPPKYPCCKHCPMGGCNPPDVHRVPCPKGCNG